MIIKLKKVIKIARGKDLDLLQMKAIKGEYESGVPITRIAETYEVTTEKIMRLVNKYGWVKTDLDLTEETFSTSLRVPDGYKLAPQHLVKLENLTMIDYMLVIHRAVMTSIRQECEEALFNKQAIKLNPRQYGFATVGELTGSLTNLLRERVKYMDSLPALEEETDLEADIKRIAEEMKLNQLTSFRRSELPDVAYNEKTAEDEQATAEIMKRKTEMIKQHGETEESSGLFIV